MPGFVHSCFVIGLIVSVFQPIRGTNSSQSGFKSPWFCHDLQCPVYTVKETNENFETREYAPSVWVATNASVVSYTNDVNRELFYRLFHYISGNNSMHMKMDMTAPVVKRIAPCQGTGCQSVHTTYFMIPFNLQSNPPTPTEAGVFIERAPAVTLYVRSFGGFRTDDLDRQNYNMLIQHLQAANKTFTAAPYFTAGYDGPYAFVRHNEIWLTAV